MKRVFLNSWYAKPVWVMRLSRLVQPVFLGWSPVIGISPITERPRAIMPVSAAVTPGRFAMNDVKQPGTTGRVSASAIALIPCDFWRWGGS